MRYVLEYQSPVDFSDRLVEFDAERTADVPRTVRAIISQATRDHRYETDEQEDACEPVPLLRWKAYNGSIRLEPVEDDPLLGRL